MYWRINCTEHLVLGVRADPTQEQSKEVKEAATSNTQPTAARLKDNGARLGRQRSITYSAGVGLNAGRRMAVPQTVDKKSTTDPTVVVRWAGTADGRLVAGITCQGIYLWTLRPFVQLSNLVYKSTEEFGSPVDLVWKHEEEEPMARYADYSDAQSGAVVATFFVVLSRGYVFEIAVYKRDNPVLEYEFSTQHYHVRGAGEGKGIPALGLAQKRTYRLPGSSSVVCAATTIGGYRQQQQQQEDDAESGSSALVATQSHVHRLAWTGTLVSSVDIKHIYDNPLAHIRQALCIAGFSDAATEIEVYLFSDGVIRTLTRKHRHGEGSSTLSPPPPEIRTLGAADSTHRCTVMAYTPASRLVAVGTTTGDVLLYSAAADNPEIARVGRIAFTHERGAQVSAIAWTPDGLALACGYTSGHVCVFSALGYELNITRLSATQSPRETHRNNEDGGGGVAMAVVLPVPAALVWMRGSTRLCVFSDCLSAMDGGTVLRHQQADVLPFARAASSTVACDGNTKRVCLFSDDKVFLNLCEFDQADQNQNQNQNQLQLQPELQWHVAHIPPEYIASNWPIRYVAADDDGRAIAVAGTHGVAWYSCDTQRWRMLRNQQQEEAITCVGGLLWYHNYLVVACINRECGDLAQLLFFARNRQLDMTSDMQTVVLEHPAATISCHNSNLLVLCRNNMLYQYAIFDDVDFIQVAFRRQIDLSTSGAPVVEPPRVRSLQWVPSALFDTRPAFLVHQGTTLMVVEELPFDEAGAGAGTGTGGAMDAEGVLLRTAVVSDQVEMTITSG
ncbi:WD40 repeat protein, partial [Coemansia sp. RSA 1804]